MQILNEIYNGDLYLKNQVANQIAKYLRGGFLLSEAFYARDGCVQWRCNEIERKRKSGFTWGELEHDKRLIIEQSNFQFYHYGEKK